MARSKRKPTNDVAMAIEKSDFDALLAYALQHRSKTTAFSFQNEFKNRPESDIAMIISNLCKMVINCMDKFLAKNCAPYDADSCNMAGKLIQVAVDIASATLQLNFHLQCHVEIAILLNGILPAVPESQDGVKNSIAQYCEKLCLKNVADEKCECYLFNVFLYLLQKTLRKRVFKADIKRIYAIRGKLGKVMELEETPKDEIWELFKQCAISNSYLSILEGQKIIALSMTFDINEIFGIHKLIMQTLPTLNIKFASPYGRIYFEAWCYCLKAGKLDIKRVIEITCLQDIILAAIHGGRRPVLSIIRKILAQFHINKKDQEVSKMLYCLYQPLLWRFLKNPDGQIRANAAQLFLDIFPLEDPEVKVVATDLELNDQLLMIKDLLVDDFPIVRITAVIGICISMSVNWEVYPEEMIKTYFRIIVNDLSRDSSNSEVRCAVVKGLKCLLENPLTMQCLVGILPKMVTLFHDNCEDVRVAFCQLLLRVKTISAIKYFDVVPATHLFARLEEDSHVMRKSISNLLINSYFPMHEDEKVWLGRCLELMKTERASSRVFFSYAASLIGVENAVKFMILAVKAINFYIKTKCSPTIASTEFFNKENISNMDDYMSSLEEAMGFGNLEVVSTVMDSLVVMWLSIRVEIMKPENKPLLKYFVKKMSGPLADLCRFYKDTEAWESVFYMISFLPPLSIPSFVGLCLKKLKDLSPNAQSEDFLTLLECLCNQSETHRLLNILKESIDVGLKELDIAAPTKKRRKNRRIENVPVCEVKPYLGNRMLNVMINHRIMQKAILMQTDWVGDFLCLLDDIKLKLEHPSTREIDQDNASFLSLLVNNIISLSTLIQDGHVGNIQFLDDAVRWANQSLLKLLTFSAEMTDPFSNLVFSICQSIAEIVADVIALGYCDPTDDIYLLFFENLLLSEMGYRYALLCTRFLYKYTASGMHLYVVAGDTVMTQHLIKSLCNVFGTLANESLIQCLPPDDNVRFVIANIMQVVRNHIAELSEPVSQAFKCFLKNILDGVITKTSDVVNKLADDPFDKISFPTISTFFLKILNLKPDIIPTYIKFLTEMCINSKKDISLWIANWAVIYHILSKKDLTKPILRETNALVNELGKTILEIYPCEKISEKPVKSPQMQIFQRHCHAEFLKLKRCLISKITDLKKNKK